MANWVQVTNDDDVKIALNLDHATWLYANKLGIYATTIVMADGSDHKVKESLFWVAGQWTTHAPDYSMPAATIGFGPYRRADRPIALPQWPQGVDASEVSPDYPR